MNCANMLANQKVRSRHIVRGWSIGGQHDIDRPAAVHRNAGRYNLPNVPARKMDCCRSQRSRSPVQCLHCDSWWTGNRSMRSNRSVESNMKIAAQPVERNRPAAGPRNGCWYSSGSRC